MSTFYEIREPHHACIIPPVISDEASYYCAGSLQPSKLDFLWFFIIYVDWCWYFLSKLVKYANRLLFSPCYLLL